MPPRKRGAAAKKPSPRTRASTRTSKKQVVPLNVVEENEVPQPEVPVIPVVERESNLVDEVSVAEGSVAEGVPPSTDEEKVVVKEEVSVTTVVVEETKVIEEIVEEKNLETVVVVEETKVLKEIAEEKNTEETLLVEETKVVEEIMEEKNAEKVAVEEAKVGEEEIVEEKKLEAVVVEEKKVVEEIVEEKNPEITSSEAGLDAEMEKKAPEDPEEVEEDPEEIEEDPEEVIEDGNDNKDDTMNEDQVAKQDINEETADAEVEDTIGGRNGQDTTDANEGGDMEGEGESGTDDEENEEDEDPSAYMHAPLSDRKKQKEFEIFVGGLDKGAVEEDLTKVFAEFGEIQSVRIVKHPTTQKSKGFAFIRYATVEQAKKALAELKDGTEVRGKRVGISPSQDSDTLYMGNICKTWKKDQVLETLKTLGIEQVEEVYLPDDPKTEGKIRGFALLEFTSHSDAMAAFQRLRKPDAIFGCDRSAKVAFAQSSIHPSDEALSQVKTVFVEGLTDSWNEEKLREFCKQYGEIEKVQLSRNLVTTKRKDFGFVSFTSRESAVACVEAINNAQIAEGDVKVKANLAKPQYKGRLGKQAARGGYKVNTDVSEDAGPSKIKGQAKSNGSEGKGKFLPKLRSIKGGKPFKPQSRVGERQGTGAPFRSDRTDRHRMEHPGRGGRRGGRSMEAGFHGQPSRNPRGNMNGRPSRGFGNPRNNSRFGNTRQNYGGAPSMYVDPYAQGYAASASSYRGHAVSASSYRGHAASASSHRGHAASASSYRGHAYGAHSGSKRHYSDMDPHAGYIEPSTTKQGRDRYGYEPRRGAGGYGAHGSGAPAYGGGSVPSSSYAPGPSAFAGYETVGSGYVYPSGAVSYPHPHPHPPPQPQPQPQPQPHPYPQPQQPQPQQHPPRQGYY
ncbi:RNA recognition motif domain [Macleaya cordata]|uniref:RNA recognition motif domain n=1 Tax=Macleaya cordata TaxID=56857 RepID=A0A200R7M8_MACCD|nr:RNA recognition motif domain [Macleaya cordata]